MGYYTPDVYNQPEKFGIEVVGSIDLAEPCYSFDMFVVWKRPKPDGTYEFGWLTDSGCSCPSPFEDNTNVNDIHWGTALDVSIGLGQTLEEGYYTDAEKANSHDEFFTIVSAMLFPSP